MRLPELCDKVDRIEAGILGQCVGNDLQGVSEFFGAIGVHASHALGELFQPEGHLGLGGTSSGNHEPLLDERSDDTLGVMHRAVGLCQDKFVTASEQDSHGLSWVLDPGHLDDFVSTSGGRDLTHSFGESQLVGTHRVNVGDGVAAQRAADELNVGPLNVSNYQDAHLSEEVKGKLVVSVAKDTLLDKKDIAATLLDLLAQAQNKLFVGLGLGD